MAKENNLTDFLTDVASAIKDKRGIGSVNAQDFSTEIRAIEPLLDTLDITENGEHDVKDYKNVSVLVENTEFLELKNYFDNEKTAHPRFIIPYGVEKILRTVDTSSLEIPLSVKEIKYNTLCDSVIYKGEFSDWLKITKNLSNSTSTNNLNNGNSIAFYLEKNGEIIQLSNDDIIFPNNINEIPQGALNCLAIPNGIINIPDNITNVGSYAFALCNRIKEINFNKNSEVSFGQGCFDKINKGSNIDLTINLPITKIVPTQTFSESNVVTVNMQEGVEEIGNNAFYECTKITNIYIPNSVKKIGDYSFRNLKISEIVIPENVESIGNNAFYSGSSTLKTITILGRVPFTIASNSFSKISGMKIYVPKGTSEAFKSATNWSSYASYIYEKYAVVLNIPSALLNNETITYSIDGGKTYQMFTNSVLSLNEVATIKIKSTDSSQTILIGTTAGGNDVGTISNSELTFSFTTDTNVYLTIQ